MMGSVDGTASSTIPEAPTTEPLVQSQGIPLRAEFPDLLGEGSVTNAEAVIYDGDTVFERVPLQTVISPEGDQYASGRLLIEKFPPAYRVAFQARTKSHSLYHATREKTEEFTAMGAVMSVEPLGQNKDLSRTSLYLQLPESVSWEKMTVNVQVTDEVTGALIDQISFRPNHWDRQRNYLFVILAEPKGEWAKITARALRSDDSPAFAGSVREGLGYTSNEWNDTSRTTIELAPVQ